MASQRVDHGSAYPPADAVLANANRLVLAVDHLAAGRPVWVQAFARESPSFAAFSPECSRASLTEKFGFLPNPPPRLELSPDLRD